MNLRWTVGDLVRKLRGEMTQEALGEIAGLNKATVNRFEMRSAKAEQETTEAIATALGTTPHDMGTYVEALNLANQIAQLGAPGRERVKRFLDERTLVHQPAVVPSPGRESPGPAKGSAAARRGTTRKPRGGK